MAEVKVQGDQVEQLKRIIIQNNDIISQNYKQLLDEIDRNKEFSPQIMSKFSAQLNELIKSDNELIGVFRDIQTTYKDEQLNENIKELFCRCYSSNVLRLI